MVGCLQALDEAIQLIFHRVVHGSRMAGVKDLQQLQMMVLHTINPGIATQPKFPLAVVPLYYVPPVATLQELEVKMKFQCTVHVCMIAHSFKGQNTAIHIA